MAGGLVTMLQKIQYKALEKITAEWDELASLRLDQITSGIDITYNHILIPSVIRLVSQISPTRVLDAGCGVGVLSKNLSTIAREVIGIDPSSRSIEIARTFEATGVRFVHTTIEQFAASNDILFDSVVANMVIMDTPDLAGFLSSARQVLHENGVFIFTLTHPCFWPTYYGYASETWFKYNEEIMIEDQFRISRDRSGSLMSTHIHRPLEVYFMRFAEAGFVIETLQEPMPAPNVEAMYSEPWSRPRYLIGSCRVV